MKKKILFLGTHGQYNIGDELLLETFLTQLGPDHDYIVNSYDPGFTQAQLKSRFNITAFHTTRQLPQFARYLATSDLLFFGGGSIIKELYASVGRNPYSTLGMILGTVLFAKRLARKPVVMSNIGVGPITTPTGRRLARAILNCVDVLSVRDDTSLNTCLSLGVSPQKVRRVPDAVFVNPCEALLSAASDELWPVTQTQVEGWGDSRGDGRLKVALNLNYDIENRAAWDNFVNQLADALTQWNAQTPLTLHALPMQSKFKAHDDLSVLKAFQVRVPEIPMVLHDPQTAQAAAAIIDACDIVVAERLHTLVLSTILGKPFFGLIYDIKVKELIRYLGMLDHALDINQPFTADALLAGFQAVHAQRREISRQVAQRANELRAELNGYFDDVRQRMHLV